MANTITAFNTTFLGFDVDAIKSELDQLIALKPNINEFSAFSTLFKDVPSGITTVTVPVATYPSASVDLSSGPSFLDAGSSGITVKIDTDTGVLYKFNPVEAQQNGLANLVKVYLDPAVYGTERTLFSSSLGQGITNAFGTASLRVAADNCFSSSAVPRIGADCASSNIRMDFVMTSQAKWWNLVDDLSTKGNAAGALAVSTGNPSNPFGVPVLGNNLIPTMTGSAGIGTGNVVAIAGQKSNVVLATAIPDVPHVSGESFIYTSPRSGISFLIENYFDESRRANVIGATVLYKAASGVSSWKLITDKA